MSVETVEISDIEADAGGRALRERQQGGRKLRPWSDVPRHDRKKWTDTARVVLAAAKEAVVNLEIRP